MSEDSKIEIKIQTTYNGTGANQAQKNIDKLSQQGKTTLGQTLPTAAEQTQNCIKRIATMAGKARQALSEISRGVGWIGMVITAFEALKKLYSYLTDKAQTVIRAGQNIAVAWKNAADATRLQTREQETTAALQRQADAIARILQQKRALASFDAQTRALEARANGNLRAARRAELDGRLARDEITASDHRTATRQLEDEETNERHTAELAAETATLAEKETALTLAREKGQKAITAQQQTIEALQNAGVLKQDHTFNDFHATSGGLVRLAEQYADAVQTIQTMKENGRGYLSQPRYQAKLAEEEQYAEQLFARLATAAEALNINPYETKTITDGENEKTIRANRDPYTLLQEIKTKTDETLKNLNNNIQTSAREIADATLALEQQRHTNTLAAEARAAEQQKTARTRQEEDKTDLHRQTAETTATATATQRAEENARAAEAEKKAAEAENAAAQHMAEAVENLAHYLDGSGKILITDQLEQKSQDKNSLTASTAAHAKKLLADLLGGKPTPEKAEK